ncbi:hypothetical protein L218DRAFT_309310 [Marasmius fiardii PR-910]|nr:hypothetical protein L218DRAFT_309310 [Marasmius fiardii PR-910]
MCTFCVSLFLLFFLSPGLSLFLFSLPLLPPAPCFTYRTFRNLFGIWYVRKRKTETKNFVRVTLIKIKCVVLYTYLS